MNIKIFNLFWLVLALILPGCQKNADDPDGQGALVTQSTELEYVYLSAVNNLLLGRPKSNAGIVTQKEANRTLLNVEASTDIGLLTIEASGDIKPVKAKGGQGKKIKKLRRITKRGNGASKVKSALQVYDEASGRIEYYLIDQADQAHQLRRNPRPSHKIKNGAMFWERDKIYYLDISNDLLELDISQDVSEDNYQVIRSGVEQAVMDKQGNWMLALSDGRVVHRNGVSGWEERMDDHIPYRYDNAEEQKFFLPQGAGFLFLGDGGYCGAEIFYRAGLDMSGDLRVTHSQPDNLANCSDTNNATLCVNFCFYPWRRPEVCSYQAVGAEELLFCDGYVYQLGDASHDLKTVDFFWAGHWSADSFDDIKTTASSNFLYHYSNSTLYGGSRLTRIDLDNTACQHLFSRDITDTCPSIVSNTEYLIDEMTATEDDTVRFCGRRLGETQLLLVEIIEADTATPQFRETEISQCGQLLNL